MFITAYSLLSNLHRISLNEFPSEVLVFGGTYPLSPNQVLAMGKAVGKCHNLRALALNFTRIKNRGLKALCESLKSDSYKAKRANDRGLYSLDLTNNFIEGDGIIELVALFHDQFIAAQNSHFQINFPVPTTIRSLTLNHNLLGRVGADAVAQLLETSRTLFSLSIRSCRIEGRDVRRLSVALQQNKTLRYLDLGSNKLGDEGSQLIAEALSSN